MMERRSTPVEILRYGLITIVLIWTVFPIAWLILTSFKPANDIMVSLLDLYSRRPWRTMSMP
jgi:multiple sugar transport system permease protein